MISYTHTTDHRLVSRTISQSKHHSHSLTTHDLSEVQSDKLRCERRPRLGSQPLSAKAINKNQLRVVEYCQSISQSEDKTKGQNVSVARHRSLRGLHLVHTDPSFKTLKKKKRKKKKSEFKNWSDGFNFNCSFLDIVKFGNPESPRSSHDSSRRLCTPRLVKFTVKSASEKNKTHGSGANHNSNRE